MARFLTGAVGGELRWACVDENSLGSNPAVAERRFSAYVAPFTSDEDAARALLDAGCDPVTITAEIRPKKARRA